MTTQRILTFVNSIALVPIIVLVLRDLQHSELSTQEALNT